MDAEQSYVASKGFVCDCTSNIHIHLSFKIWMIRESRGLLF